MAMTLNPREKYVRHTLREPSATLGASEWLDISGFPSGALHIFGAAGATFEVAVELSNVENDDAAVVDTTVTAKALVPLTKCAAFVRVNVIAASGNVSAIYAGQPQS